MNAIASIDFGHRPVQLAWLVAVLLASAAGAAWASPAHASHRHGPTSGQPANGAGPSAKAGEPRRAAAVAKLPQLPAGVAELKFGEFFVRPVGPRGLELTDKLRGLDGQRVRILGYMAHRDVQPPGAFLLTPFPVEIHDHDNALAEDLPASVVSVSVPTLPDQPVPFAPGLMLVTGRLSVGPQPESDGRVSLVRLALDPPEKHGRERSLAARKRPGKGAEILRGSQF